MRRKPKLWNSQRERGKKERERELSLEKPKPKALPACSQNKGLSEYQRRALVFGRAIPSWRQVGGSQSLRGAISAPERASPIKLQRGFQFLTKTS